MSSLFDLLELDRGWLDHLRGWDRVRGLVNQVEQAARSGQVEYDYGQAAYGLAWSLTSGRLNAETANAIEAMDVEPLCELVHELKEHDYRIGCYPAFLMQKYTRRVEV
jgi:hypothetical protein